MSVPPSVVTGGCGGSGGCGGNGGSGAIEPAEESDTGGTSASWANANSAPHETVVATAISATTREMCFLNIIKDTYLIKTVLNDSRIIAFFSLQDRPLSTEGIDGRQASCIVYTNSTKGCLCTLEILADQR